MNIGHKNNVSDENSSLTLSNIKQGTDLGTLVVPFDFQTFHPLHKSPNIAILEKAKLVFFPMLFWPEAITPIATKLAYNFNARHTEDSNGSLFTKHKMVCDTKLDPFLYTIF